MAQGNIIERIINIFVNNKDANQSLDQTTNKLNKVDSSTIKVTQSTSNLTKQTHSHTEAIVKNGGAMGLLNELTGGLAMTFKDASEAIGLAGISLTSFKGILLATGIGAAVIAIGYLVSNWKELKGAIDGSTDAANKFLATQIKINEQRRIAKQTQTENIEELQHEIDLMKTRGESADKILQKEKELNALKTKNSKQNFEINQAEIKVLNDRISKDEDYQDLLKKRDEIEADIMLNKSNRASAAYKNDEQSFRIADEILKLNQEKLQSINDEITVYEDANENIKKRKELEIQNREEYTTSAKMKREDEKLTATRQKEIADAKKTANEKAKADLKALQDREKTILDQLKEINKAIEANVESFRKEVNATDAEKMAQGLNGQYVALMKVYDARQKLIEQQQKARDLANKEGGISPAEQKQLNNIQAQINAYDELAKTKTKQVLESPESDKNLNARLEVIHLNLQAELTMRRGFEYDALQLKQQAFEKEATLRENAIIEEKNKIDIALADNQKLLDKAVEGSEEFNKLTAIKNDLTKQQIKTTSDLTIEQANNDQAIWTMQADAYQVYRDKMTEIDNNYYNGLMITSQNLQGFLAQLQDEQIVKSKDLRNVLLIAEKGLAIAGVVTNTIKENSLLAKTAVREKIAAIASTAAYDYPGAALHTAAAAGATAGIGLNKINAGISIASILATTLTSWNRSGGGSGTGSGGGTGPQAQFNIVGSSGNNQLAASIAAQQNQPVNAYVVSSDMSTAQQLDRNKIRTATFL